MGKSKAGRKGAKPKAPGYNNQAKFEGKTKELKGSVYDHSSDAMEMAVLYVKTTKKVTEYAGHKYEHGSDIALAIEDLQRPTLEMPDNPPPNATKAQIRLWEKRVEHIAAREICLDKNIRALYWLVWGQCTYAMRFMIKGLDNYADMSQKSNGIELLSSIKKIVFVDIKKYRYLPLLLHEAYKRFYTLKQGQFRTLEAYLEEFQTNVEVIENYGGEIGVDPAIAFAQQIYDERGLDPDTATSGQKNEVLAAARELLCATGFLVGADQSRYGNLIVQLENEYLQGRDNYPKTLNEAYCLLCDWAKRTQFHY